VCAQKSRTSISARDATFRRCCREAMNTLLSRPVFMPVCDLCHLREISDPGMDRRSSFLEGLTSANGIGILVRGITRYEL